MKLIRSIAMPWPVFEPPAEFVDPIDKEKLIDWVQERAEVWFRKGGHYMDVEEHIEHMKVRRTYMEGITVHEIMIQVLDSFPAEEFGLA
jgi:hypothetical protein